MVSLVLFCLVTLDLLNFHQIAVLFYEKKQKKIWFQFSKSEELICWEQWAITITVVDPQTESGIPFAIIFENMIDSITETLPSYCRTTQNTKNNGASIKPKSAQDTKHN
jgi:hypothetical protein